jgi:peptidase M48-like protein
MFYLLSFSLVLAVMFAVMALATLTSLPAVKLLQRATGRIRAGSAANLLFTVRALPLLLGTAASLGFTLPAFLEFEPHSTREMPGPALLLLAGLGLLSMLAMARRYWRILRSTISLELNWLKNGTRLPVNCNGIPVFCVNDRASLVAVVGIFAPKIFVSRDVANLLSEEELSAALCHELAHVSTADNLRKLLLQVMGPPEALSSLADLDALWAGASEIAADERAIAQGASALDLSSALVKVGRLSMEPHPQLAASHLVDNSVSATQARAGRLRELLNSNASSRPAAPHDSRPYHWLGGGALALLVYLLSLGAILPAVHEALEFFVRY